MKRFLSRIIQLLKAKFQELPNDNANISFIGSWRLISIVDSQGDKQYPRWKEVWSFAAMNEEETNGIYACDYINLHTIIGNWKLANGRLKLVRKECESEYILAELSDKHFILKTNLNDSKESLIFERVV